MKFIKNVFVFVLLYASSSLFGSAVAQKKTTPTGIAEKKFGSLFAYLGAWPNKENPKHTMSGWLTVRDEQGNKKGEVLIRLDGASFYDPRVSNDFRIRYVGHDDNGCQHDLPKGLYYWAEGPSNGFKGLLQHRVRPSFYNRYSDYAFGLDLGVWNTKGQWCGAIKEFNDLCWDPGRAKYVHPSKEISDILAAACK